MLSLSGHSDGLGKRSGTAASTGSAVVAAGLLLLSALAYAAPVQAFHPQAVTDRNEQPVADIQVGGTCSPADNLAFDDDETAVVEDLDADGEICVELDGSGSSDPDEDENQATCHRTGDEPFQSYQWFRNGAGAGASDSDVEERTDDTGQPITWGLEVVDWCGNRSERDTIDVVYEGNDDPRPKFGVVVREDADGDDVGQLEFTDESEDNATVESVDWTVRDAGGSTCAAGNGTPFVANCSVGNWTVELTATDDGGASTTLAVDSAQTAVPAIPPNTHPSDPQIAGVSCNNQTGGAGDDEVACRDRLPTRVTLDGEGTDEELEHTCQWSDADGAPTDCSSVANPVTDPLTCHWDFDDGATATASCADSADHNYTDFDRFNATLQVEDRAGATSASLAWQNLSIDAPQPPTLINENFDASTGTDYFLGGGAAQNGEQWTLDGVAHVSAACRGGTSGMYGAPLSQDSALQFNTKVLFDGFVPFTGEQRVAPDETGDVIDPAPASGTAAGGPRCTYEDVGDAPASGEAVLEIPASDLASADDRGWTTVNLAFDQDGELEPDRPGELDRDRVTVQVSNESGNWTTKRTWEHLSDAPSRPVFGVDRSSLGSVEDPLFVRFAFEADRDFNDHRGWFVDNLEVVGSDQCPEAISATPSVVIDEDGDGTATVPLDGSPSSDRENGIESYAWLDDDGTFLDRGPTAEVQQNEKSRNYTLAVTDATGCTDTTTFTVNVSQEPVARATFEPGTSLTDHDGSGDENVTLDGSNSSDPEDDAVACEWTRSDGSTVASDCVADATVAVGNETFTLVVEDSAGATDNLSAEVEVDPNPVPDADAGPNRTVRDKNRSGFRIATLDASNSTDASPGEITAVEWTDADGNVVGNESKITVNVSSAPDPGANHTFELQVTDDGGATDTDNVTLSVVENELPTMDPGSTCDHSCTLTANADDDTAVAECTWLFLHDDSTSTGCAVDHTFPEPGEYTVNLTVTDEEGQTNRTNLTVTPTGVFVDGFEDGSLGDWTLDGTSNNLWHVADDCETENDMRNGSFALQFNREDACNYATNNTVNGSVTRTADLTGATEANLTFHHFYDVEDGCPIPFDQMWVNASADGGSTWTVLKQWECPGTSDGWLFEDLDLDAFAGDTVEIRFEFDSKDDSQNDGTGWLVDRISVW